MILNLNVILARATKSLAIFFVAGIFTSHLYAQSIPGKANPLKHVEPGLENAVKWKWLVSPSDLKDWGLQPAGPAPTPTPAPTVTPVPTPEIRPTTYEVKRGDAVILIGKKFGMTIAQVKTFNGLKDNTIRVGQILKIPTLAELKAMAPPPEKHKSTETHEPKLSSEAEVTLDKLKLQIFLDREQFSSGPIATEPGPAFARLSLLYQSTHEDAKDEASLAAKADAALTDVFAHYKLKWEDFRFIAPPKAEAPVKKSPSAPAHPHAGKPIVRPPPSRPAPLSYDELTALSMLAYRTPWEFVAERFHCQESYLRSLNEKLPAVPGIGMDFRVPNVIPFEIEKAFDEPIQPQADPNNPVTAAVVALSQLNIFKGSALVAVLPLSPARPGRLGTFQEEWRAQTAQSGPSYASPTPEPMASPPHIALTAEQYLAAGPRNPVGIFWLNLAKAKSTEPLPYGLHGTSIPDQMNTQESIGGFRLANWDIARVVRLLPVGTPLQWK
jgi:LysM repeat protein/lipoprotein-anchoring transpeptidase ErfK/SrfK